MIAMKNKGKIKTYINKRAEKYAHREINEGINRGKKAKVKCSS